MLRRLWRLPPRSSCWRHVSGSHKGEARFSHKGKQGWEAYSNHQNFVIERAIKASNGSGTVALPGIPFEVRWGDEAHAVAKLPRDRQGLEGIIQVNVQSKRIREVRRDVAASSSPGQDGWHWGMSLDGEGGGEVLKPWDPRVAPTPTTASTFARGGCFLSLDLSHAKARDWLEAQAPRRCTVPETNLRSPWTRGRRNRPSLAEPYVDDLSTSTTSRSAARLASQRLTTLVEGDKPRFLVQRQDGNPHNPASAVICSLRSLTSTGASSSADIAAVTLRLRLSKSMLLVARMEGDVGHGNYLEQRHDLLDGVGDRSPSELFAGIVEIMVDRCGPAVEALDREIFALRERLEEIKALALLDRESELTTKRLALATLRQRTIRLLRYLRPQREALDGLLRWAETEETTHRRRQEILTAEALVRCREAKFRLSALVEELQALAQSGKVLQDELVALNSEQQSAAGHTISKIALSISMLALGQVGLDAATFTHKLGLIDLNAIVETGGRF